MTTKQALSICAIIVIATLAIMINLRAYHERHTASQPGVENLGHPFINHSELTKFTLNEK
jgi:hypothetical protein